MTAATAQTVPPILVPELPQGEKIEPITLSKIEINTRIFGFIAETSMIMVFYNPNQRRLAGDLYFPLPQGATVSGYALDINGQMVDGSVVEKARGRQVFEKIVRQGIDPGLIEWVKGNNFKTRVFPIPGRGSRTIAVRYVSDLVSAGNGTSYRIPLNFKDEIKDFFIKVEAVKAASGPVITGGKLSGFAFKKWRDSFVAETALKNIKLTEDLVITIPAMDRKNVTVEKSGQGEYYFCIDDFPAVPATPETGRDTPPSLVTVFWDASTSRSSVDHQKELDLLKHYFSRFKDTKVEVDLVVFRNVAEQPRSFTVTGGRVDDLLKALGTVRYDGGTSLGSLSLKGNENRPDHCLLFTDGISNFGSVEPEDLPAPLYIFSCVSGSNHPLLKYLAMKTGGAYFNLNRVELTAAADGIGRPAYSFISATFDDEEATDVYPSIPEKITGRFTAAGRLTGDNAVITLNYGINGKIKDRIKFTVSRETAASGTLLRRFWAQKKVDELQVFADKNEAEIVRTGKKYGLLTPFTSLIVLDNFEQYLEHRILPPKTLPTMRDRYLAANEQEETRAGREKESKIEYVLGLWKTRVKWWDTEFTYPKNFRIGGAQKEEREDRGSSRNRRSPAPSMAEEGFSADLADEASLSEAMPSMSPRAASKKATVGKSESKSPEPAIVIKPWTPQTPYGQAINKADPSEQYDVYLHHKAEYGTSPAFFLDCSDIFFNRKHNEIGLRILSNIAELELENAALLRVLGHRLAQIEELELAAMVFEEVLKLRPEEPQSYRDLALVLARKGEYSRAVELLYHVVLNRWDRFAEIELISLMELNTILAKAKRAGIKDLPYVDERLVKLLDVDVRIILTWDADLTDIDLWIIEPSGEKAFYSHRRTTIGGNFSRDFTQGYGPEEYLVRKAMNGVYSIKTNFFGSSAQKLIGAVTLQVDVFTNYGRENEKRKSITLRLKDRKETVDIGEIEF